jgi:hypothetical protein
MKKKIINFIFITLFFSYGFISSHFSIFPFNQIQYVYKSIKNNFVNSNNLYSEYLTIRQFHKLDQNEKLIRDKYKNWNKKIKIIQYRPNLPIWSDRNYINLKNNKKLDNLFIIQIPKHHKSSIKLSIDGTIIIYRVLCEKNDNKKFKNFKNLNFELLIISESCIHNNIVAESVSENFYEILPGGPISSNPIFIGNSDNKINFKILD